MARDVRTDLIRIQVRGTGRRGTADDFSRAQRALQDEIIRVMRQLEIEARAALVGAMPEPDTGDLADSLSSRFFFRADRVRFTVEGGAPGHGGDDRGYIGVTREGHREQRIYPTTRRALKVHVAGHRNPHAAVFRAWVTGVGHPHQDTVRAVARAGGSVRELRRAHRVRDWVADADVEIERLAERATSRLGRRLEVSIR